MSNTVLDRAGVKAKFDVFPEQIIDYLALVGDSSDNIPGIDKVGPKTAAKWLGQYHDARRAGGGCRQRRAARSARTCARASATLELARKLATIRTDLTLPVTLEDLKRRPPDVDALRALYSQARAALAAQAARWRRGDRGGDGDRRRGAAGAAAAAAPGDARRRRRAAIATAPRLYETITTDAQLDAWIAKLSARGAVRVRHRDHQPRIHARREIVGVSFAVAPGVAAYVPLRHDYAGAPDQLDRDAEPREAQAAARIREARARSAITSSTTRTCSRNHGIALRGMRFDSMLESYVWNSVPCATTWTRPRERYLGIRTIHYEDVAGKGAKQIPFSQVPVDKAAEYSAEDADVTLRLHQVLWPQIARGARAARRCTRRSSSRWCRCCCAWKNTACCSTGRCCARRAASSPSACMEAARRGAQGGRRARSTSIRPSSSAPSCSRRCSCRWCARRRPASRRPPRTCSRSSPRATRCRS